MNDYVRKLQFHLLSLNLQDEEQSHRNPKPKRIDQRYCLSDVL